MSVMVEKLLFCKQAQQKEQELSSWMLDSSPFPVLSDEV
jgi:hypothetical protein